LRFFLAKTHVVADIDVQQEIEGSPEAAYGFVASTLLKLEEAVGTLHSVLRADKNHLWINFTNP
jgi:hypothetical protein